MPVFPRPPPPSPPGDVPLWITVCSCQEVPQVFGHFMGRGVTLRSSLGHRLQANSFQFLRQLFVILPQGTRLVTRHLLQQFSLRITPERLATGQQLVEHDAQTENVAAAIDPMSLRHGPVRDSCRPASRRTSVLCRCFLPGVPARNQRRTACRRCRSGCCPASHPDGRVPACGRNAGRQRRWRPVRRLPGTGVAAACSFVARSVPWMYFETT